MLWNSAGSLAFLGAQWLITVLVVRLSSNYDAAGVLALATVTLTIFAPVAEYKMRVYQVSDVTNEHSVGEYVAFRVVTVSIALTAIIIYAAITCPPRTLVAIYLYALTRLLSLIIDVLHATDQVNGRMDYIGQSLVLQGLGTLVAFTAVFATTHSLQAAFAAMAVVTVVIGLVFDLPRALRFGAIHVGISPKRAVRLLALAAPVVAAAVAAATAPSIPRQFLAARFGEASLGIYASVAAPAALIQMSASYIYIPLIGVFANHFAHHRTREVARLMVRVLASIAGVGLVAAVALQLVGPWLLRLMFGASITPYFYLMQPIILLTILTAYLWFFSDLLITLRAFAGNLIGNVAGLLASLGLTPFFVMNWDKNGVSFTGIAAYGLASTVMAFFLIRRIRRGPSERSSTTP